MDRALISCFFLNCSSSNCTFSKKGKQPCVEATKVLKYYSESSLSFCTLYCFCQSRLSTLEYYICSSVYIDCTSIRQNKNVSGLQSFNWSTKAKFFWQIYLWYKAMLKVLTKFWEPFGIYQLTGTANPAQFHLLWPDWLC